MNDELKLIITKYNNYGYNELTDDEKLILLLSYSESPENIYKVAESIKTNCGETSIAIRSNADFLMKECGASVKSAVLFELIFQLRRRCDINTAKNAKLDTPENAGKFFSAFSRGCKKEIFAAAALNNGFTIKSCEIMSYGTLNDVRSTARAVAEFALKNNSKSIFVFHCHPNGSCEPSAADIDATQRIQAALSELKITLIDHIISGTDGTISLREKNKELFGKIKGYADR